MMFETTEENGLKCDPYTATALYELCSDFVNARNTSDFTQSPEDRLEAYICADSLACFLAHRLGFEFKKTEEL